MKHCTKCKEVKPLSEFYKNRRMKDGLHIWCKCCINVSNNQARNRPRQIQLNRNSRLKRVYGITADDYDAMFLAQNGVCAVCFQPETVNSRYGIKRMAVDHDAKTGRVRGLLCDNCNRALGLLHDDTERILRLAAYVK